MKESLTKAHEEIRRGTPAELLAYFTEQEPRGEFVIVIEGAPREQTSAAAAPETVYQITEKIMKESEASGIPIKKSDALKEAAARLGISKNRAYALYEEIKKERS